MKYRFIFFLIIFLVAISIFCSCIIEKTAVDYLFVTVDNAGQAERISIWKSEKEGYFFFLPAYAKLELTRLNTGLGESVFVNGKKLDGQISCAEFETGICYPLTYKVYGINKETTLTFLQSRNLPTLHIDTESENMDRIHSSRENKEKASARIYRSDGMLSYSGEIKSLSGRGNSTWNEYEKKPYNIKLEQSGNLLGMGSAEKWVLLANASDVSHMKNKLIYDYSQKVKMLYAPDSRWVDLYLNGNYAGLYLLCEKIEIHPERVNIGYENTSLVSQEVEKRLIENSNPYIKTQSGQAIRIRESTVPEEKLLRLWQSAENAIMNENGIDPVTGRLWVDLIDLESWAKKYLLEEFFGNGDGGYCSQFFYTTNDSDLIYAGPVWDYDFSMYYPNAFYVNREYAEADMKTPWYPALWRKSLFKTYVKKIYAEELKPIIHVLYEDGIDAYFQLIKYSAHMDGIRWGKPADAFQKEITHIKDYLQSRMQFLDSVWIEGKQYCYIQIDTRAGNNIEIHTLNPGEPLAPILEEILAEDENLPRWHDAETKQEIDPSAPIDKDISIYAVWPSKGIEKYLPLLLPAGIIAGMFLLLLYKDYRYWRVRC